MARKMIALARQFGTAAVLGAVVLALLAGVRLEAAPPEVITLRSGNGSIGGADAKIRYIATSGSFSSFGPADFAAARAGQFARIVTPFSEPNNSWVSSSSCQ